MPATAIVVPGVPGVPGAKVPPLLTWVLPTVPAPTSVALLFTLVRLDAAIEPATISVPPLIVVGPV